MKKIIRYVVILNFLSLYQTFLPIVIGSNTAVSVQPAATFPSTDDDNTMLGFAWFQNGFVFEDNTTTCTFNDVYPVSGNVNLNGGTLYLSQDLLFHNITIVQGLGTVIGNNHVLDFCPSVTGFPTDTEVFQNVSIFLNSDFYVTSTIFFQGNCSINGNGNALILGSQGALIVDEGAILTLENMPILNIANYNIACVDDTGIIVLDDIIWQQDANLTFSHGSIAFEDQVTFMGTSTFFYTSAQTSTIDVDSQWYLTSGMCLSIGQSQMNAPVQPLAFIDQTSVLKLENSTVIITPNGVTFTKGKIDTVRDVMLEINSTSTANGLIFGDGNIADDLIFELYPGSTVTFVKGHFVLNVVSLNVIKSVNNSANVIKDAGSIFYLNQNVQFINSRINQMTGSVLTIASGKTVSFSNVTLTLATGVFQITGSQQVASTLILNGSSTSLLVDSGTWPVFTSVSNVGNMISGTGNIGAPITLQDINTQLIWFLNGTLASNIIMNGGLLTLNSELTCANSIILSGSGTVALGKNSFDTGLQDFTWTGTTTWSGSNGAVTLNANVTLAGNWVFSGQCFINGNGYTLNLTSGNIIVTPGSTLHLKNITVQNIAGSNISCQSDTGVIILDDMIWLQDANYTFSIGALQFKNSVFMQGVDTTFAYQAIQTSTVLANASLELDSNFTFSYDPIRVASQNLLAFINSSAQLILNGGTLHTTVTGLNLKKGMLSVESNSFISSEIAMDDDDIIDQGITFGDGLNSQNDMACVIEKGALLDLAQGSLNYQNLNATSFMTENILSVLNIDNQTTLRLYQTLTIGNGMVSFGSNTTLARAPGVQILGTLDVPPGGSIVYTTL